MKSKCFLVSILCKPKVFTTANSLKWYLFYVFPARICKNKGSRIPETVSDGFVRPWKSVPVHCGPLSHRANYGHAVHISNLGILHITSENGGRGCRSYKTAGSWWKPQFSSKSCGLRWVNAADYKPQKRPAFVSFHWQCGAEQTLCVNDLCSALIILAQAVIRLGKKTLLITEEHRTQWSRHVYRDRENSGVILLFLPSSQWWAKVN